MKMTFSGFENQDTIPLSYIRQIPESGIAGALFMFLLAKSGRKIRSVIDICCE